MADVARIVLPPKREDTQQLHPMPKPVGPSPTVVPPAFPVAAMTARATQQMPRFAPEAKTEEPPSEKIVTETKPVEPIVPSTEEMEDSFILKPEKVEPAHPEPAQDKAPEPIAPPVEKPVEIKADSAPPPFIPPSSIEAKPVEPLIATSDAPKVDPEAHKPEPTATPEPKVDPEAHKPTPISAPMVKEPETQPEPVTTLATSPEREKREFHLANGERVAGTVISETPESIYIEHTTLGVLTIPRSNIAKRLVEIILINGDRIVVVIKAETPDTLYVRHASLGMLTVPRAARSTRVVEAILKDGDRILGEVLTETHTFTVIRSATLGTITIPHTKLAMLNRKLEQIEMKSLPPPAPELKDK
jgi:RNase P/RNase MRP subunit p29